MLSMFQYHIYKTDHFETQKDNVRRLVLLFLTFVQHALHRICIDRHRKGERKNQQLLHECTTSSICPVLQTEESCHEPLDVIRRQVRSSPVIMTQTGREKRGVTLHLFCSELRDYVSCQKCVECLPQIKWEVVLLSNSNTNSCFYKNKISKSDFQMYILYVYVCVQQSVSSKPWI